MADGAGPRPASIRRLLLKRRYVLYLVSTLATVLDTQMLWLAVSWQVRWPR
jgi:hypothetical protein